ncbi:hypothetical protein T492DRAFT_889405 [Pavlovales sp. CCMP2436]|nr:hypothetical protein T492DRAFT_889405 [Pavlovales sp. CCMP2436]
MERARCRACATSRAEHPYISISTADGVCAPAAPSDACVPAVAPSLLAGTTGHDESAIPAAVVMETESLSFAPASVGNPADPFSSSDPELDNGATEPELPPDRAAEGEPPLTPRPGEVRVGKERKRELDRSASELMAVARQLRSKVLPGVASTFPAVSTRKAARLQLQPTQPAGAAAAALHAHATA